ncbi:MAG: S1 RNA-binding domain-containing protein [Bacilli bacterium]|nr:S1 RNA-binding domain-containing protein [Bacilli bacterium]
MIKYKIGEIVEGTIINIRPFGAIMLFDDGTKGLLHISEIANSFIKNIYRYLLIGKTYQVKVIEIADDGFLKVSMSKITQEEKDQYRSSNVKRTPVSEDCIDFEALKNKIEEWTKEEN